MNNEEQENILYLISEKVSQEFHVEIMYIKIRCSNPACKKSWGVSVYNDHINLKDLVCKDCN